MKVLSIISCLFMAYCCASPITPSNIVVTEQFFKKEFIIYTAQYDIVKIFVPFNQFNFNPQTEDISINLSSSSSEEHEEHRTVFFVEAEVNNGKKTYKGLYVYKNGKATKLLDNGRDAVATNENVIYLGANDGIYKYNEADNTAVKHGHVTDNIIQLAHNNATNAVYYLTANHEVFKLNAEATTGVKVANIKDVGALAFGFEGNTYYYDSEKNVYVLNDEINAVPKKIEGLPSKIDKIVLLAPPYGIEQGTIVVVDKTLYRLNPDATVVKSAVTLEVEPTAYAPQPTLIQFYAKDKKLYEFNMIAIIVGKFFGELTKIINEAANTIRG